MVSDGSRQSERNKPRLQSGYSLRSSDALRTQLQHEHALAGNGSEVSRSNPSLLRRFLLLFRRRPLRQESKVIAGFGVDATGIDRAEHLQGTNIFISSWAFLCELLIGFLILKTWKF